MSDIDFITEEVRRVKKSGHLGRSQAYVRLIDYLVKCTLEGRNAKEVEVATDVFDKGGEFDSNQDSLVRVYVHNLRDKLDKYYTATPERSKGRLHIPKGEYRLMVERSLPPSGVRPRRRATNLLLAAVAALLLANMVILTVSRVDDAPENVYAQIANSSVWSDVLQTDLPLLVVVGDYYIFAELDTTGNVTRMVREFDINSSADLGTLLSFDPDRAHDYMDLDLTYLPQGTAFALKDLLRVVYSSRKTVNIMPASELRITDLKSNDILYVGYISALGTLEDFVFKTSSLRIGETYDELLHKNTGTHYRSDAGIPGQSNYRDFALVSTFPGPDENQIMIVAGTRDSGLMQAAQLLASAPAIRELEAALAQQRTASPRSFEALFEVTGIDRMNLNAKLIHTANLDYQQIWRSNFANYQRPAN